MSWGKLSRNKKQVEKTREITMEYQKKISLLPCIKTIRLKRYQRENQKTYNSVQYYSLQNDQGSQQRLSYQNVALPESVYGYVDAGRKPIPVAYKNIETYVKKIQDRIQKFEGEYEV